MKHMIFSLFTVLVFLSGCSAIKGDMGIHFDSKFDLDYNSNIRKILFLSEAKKDTFSEHLNQGFETRLTKLLNDCGIEIKIVPIDRMEVDFNTRITKILNEFNADSIMNMIPNGGHITHEKDSYARTVNYDSELIYKINILDADNLKHKRWEATLNFEFDTIYTPWQDERTGSRLGTTLYNKLVNNTILHRCTLAPYIY